MKHTSTNDIIKALRKMADDMASYDGEDLDTIRIREAADRLEELEKDRVRLDWMEENPCEIILHPRAGGWNVTIKYDYTEEFYGDDLRQTTDAAMKGEG